jgi:hypothetical protein
MAHCSADLSDDMILILTEVRVPVIAFAPHTTQVFQVADLTLFGVLKRRPRSGRPFIDADAIVTFLMTVYHDFTQTMVPSNI